MSTRASEALHVTDHRDLGAFEPLGEFGDRDPFLARTTRVPLLAEAQMRRQHAEPRAAEMALNPLVVHIDRQLRKRSEIQAAVLHLPDRMSSRVR